MTPTIEDLLNKAAEDFASREVCTPEERWDFNDQREWERTRNYFLEGANFAASLNRQGWTSDEEQEKYFEDVKNILRQSWVASTFIERLKSKYQLMPLPK
jgi:hypothetical protein